VILSKLLPNQFIFFKKKFGCNKMLLHLGRIIIFWLTYFQLDNYFLVQLDNYFLVQLDNYFLARFNDYLLAWFNDYVFAWLMIAS